MHFPLLHRINCHHGFSPTGEESCLSLVWAVLDLQINNACNGVKLSEIDRQRLYRLRFEPTKSEAEEKEVVAA
jgi:hypothetical protein